MTKTSAGSGPEDAIEPVRTADGWAWVDTDCEGPGTRLIEEVDVVKYAVTPRDIDGVDHLQIEESTAQTVGPVSPSGRVICSSHWLDLEEMR
ncbi:hypothetical protein HWV07_08570 [Natronomonas salina]|uniref:hypothetical protein n=1 Tax=Natronomonas salina TaxID=1710540 RepID=UPI0015B63F02|nr:hypothetical protein [Natronomonas salina]QLD89080.1 hypothetical protein HWV07_08570 [Natronomonas salina]